MILFGVVIPGSLLIVIAWNQDWFMPGELVFLVSGEPSPAQNLSVVELFLFAVDQALRGGLTDLFEVFGLSIGSVSNNPGNVAFSSLVLGFRVLCGAVTVGLIALFARVAFGIWGVHEDVQQLAADLPDQVSA